MKWTGAAQWTKREARAGDRLPFERHIDDATIRLRDGAVMRTLHIGGMEFETQDSDQLDHAQAVREVLLRSVLDARFVLYHHVVRRRVTVASGGEFEFPVLRGDRQAVGRAARRAPAVRQRAVPDDRPAPRARQDRLAGAPPAPLRPQPRRRSRRDPRPRSGHRGACSPDLSPTAPGCFRSTGPRRATCPSRSSSCRASTTARCARSSFRRKTPTSAITCRTSASASASMRSK